MHSTVCTSIVRLTSSPCFEIGWSMVNVSDHISWLSPHSLEFTISWGAVPKLRIIGFVLTLAGNGKCLSLCVVLTVVSWKLARDKTKL